MPAKPFTILIIEDDLPYSLSLKEFFTHAGYQPVVCATGQLALDHLAHYSVDVALVDLKLPDIDGIDLIKKLHQIDPHLPIVILTAYPALESAVEGVRQKVCDYLIKPYPLIDLDRSIRQALHHRQTKGHYQDLLNQIGRNIGHIESLQALLTNQPIMADEQPGSLEHYSDRLLTYSTLRLDLVRHIVTIETIPLDTTPTEFEILAYLVHQAPRIISSKELFRRVWGTETQDATLLIRRHIYNLRQKIKNLGCRDPIRTERGLGYRIETDNQNQNFLTKKG